VLNLDLFWKQVSTYITNIS